MSTTTIENPYLQARREWQERNGSHITQARNWRILALTTSVAAVLAVSHAIYVTLRNPFQPTVVLIDSFGRSVGGGMGKPLTAEEGTKVREGIIHGLITDLRSVTSDQFAQRQWVNRAYARLKSGSPAHSMLNEHFRQKSPFDRSREELVQVQISSVMRTTEKTYEAEWVETIVSAYDGNVQSKHRWRAVMTVEEGKPQDGAAAWANPMGMYVTSLHWARQENTEQ